MLEVSRGVWRSVFRSWKGLVHKMETHQITFCVVTVHSVEVLFQRWHSPLVKLAAKQQGGEHNVTAVVTFLVCSGKV